MAKRLKRWARRLGWRRTTEYRALLFGLQRAAEHGTDEVIICSDSELLVRQLNGAYRVCAPNLRPLHGQAKRAMAQFKRVLVQHIPRE